LRMASAMTVSIGLMPIGPGNKLASATNNPGTPCTAPKLSVTPRRGSSLIRAVPIRWIEYSCIEALGTGPASKARSWSGLRTSGVPSKGSSTRRAPAANSASAVSSTPRTRRAASASVSR
jgi:hypothetical protein